jgi:RNA polymerase sigma-70 factor (ECF subfamily)
MTSAETIDALHRDAYGRLVAYLARRSRDIAAAEDAVADAFRAALENWPRDGMPEKPEAWLLTAARRRLLDVIRHDRVRAAAEPELRRAAESHSASPDEAIEADVIPDERLQLLFACAHPAIDPAVRTPLMLQAVLGLNAERIASAFLVAPATMGQRLVRAKAKIRDAGIALVLPAGRELPDRLADVLDAIYAAFGTGWDACDGGDVRGLEAEAVWLGRVVAQLMPHEPEARGLVSLMLHCHARRSARRDAGGAFVPLTEQDPSRWDAAMIADAESHLRAACAFGRPGRYQLEAAIQSVHADRARTGRVEWKAVEALYDALARLHPTYGVLVGRAAAVAEATGAGEALSLLDQLPADRMRTYQPFWAVRAHVLAKLNAAKPAADAYDRAIGLSDDPAVRAHLTARRDALGTSPPPA